ncbi:MAG: hypothetical protein CM1200mP28_10090 [Deltaproteobacteria bacterium]|nr:MAG: hypothetical protein CM1200mP28_10090 [Deltaproteobacteria bacterium]
MKMNAPFLEGKKTLSGLNIKSRQWIVGWIYGPLFHLQSRHIGLYRDPETLVAVEYYMKLPELINGRLV